jgi:CrcB protein
MKDVFCVGLGGCLGAIGRYKLANLLLPYASSWRFPVATFAINVLGCFLIGVCAALIEKHGTFSQEIRHFLITGILGGFTTFSAFGLEGVTLLRHGDPGMAFTYASSSIICGMLAVWFATKLVQMIL